MGSFFYSTAGAGFALPIRVSLITLRKGQLLGRLDSEGVAVRAYKYITAQILAVLFNVIETWIETAVKNRWKSLRD